jgi:hypothetical protein
MDNNVIVVLGYLYNKSPEEHRFQVAGKEREKDPPNI